VIDDYDLLICICVIFLIGKQSQRIYDADWPKWAKKERWLLWWQKQEQRQKLSRCRSLTKDHEV